MTSIVIRFDGCDESRDVLCLGGDLAHLMGARHRRRSIST
jgi:hypothetical protein